MRKITISGIFIIMTGLSLILYSIMQGDNLEMINQQTSNRGILILGFILIAGGGLIAISPFGRH